jgi:hypothetical protein
MFFLSNDTSCICIHKGKALRWIQIHDIVRSLSPRSEALPFFHAFTGCDTVSAFVWKCEKTAWQAWNVLENAKEVFHCFSITTCECMKEG